MRSPGISPLLPLFQSAREKGVTITSQTQLFLDNCPCEIIGVTGTKGKGTTATLIAEMLKKEGKDVYLGGNIGVPALTFLDNLTPESTVVLELSSFQLMDITRSPHISVMLMMTSEHLDYHKDVYEYINAKRNIIHFQLPTDFAVLNIDYPATRESDIYTDAKIYEISRGEELTTDGCFVRGEYVVLRTNGEDRNVIKTNEILLPGSHNLENVCAAVMAANLAGATLSSIIAVLKSFKGLEHRLELVRTVSGVRYYDDSFSTTPETAEAAIQAFVDPEILILGGSSKNSDFSNLGSLISLSTNIKAIIGIGEEWKKIKSNIKDLDSKIRLIEDCKDMHEVVQEAASVAEFGDVVLLTPACASFDKFENYKDRGEQFKKEVNALNQVSS